jgi:hypothetical protein
MLKTPTRVLIPEPIVAEGRPGPAPGGQVSTSGLEDVNRAG